MLRKTKFNSKAVHLLLCIIAAFCLWVYVTYFENPDMTRWVTNIPVTITGEAKLNENNLAVKLMSDTKIDIKIRAKRNMFKDLSAETIKAVVDVSSITQTGEATLTAQVTAPASSGITYVDRSKMDVKFNVEEYITKEFTIQPVISKNPSDGYYVNSVTVNENKEKLITASGCASDIEKINHIATEAINLSDATDNVIKTLSFIAVDENSKSIDGIKLSEEGAELTFEIYKEAPIPVTIEVTADDEALSYEISPTAIYVTGPAATVDAIEPITAGYINELNYTDGDSVSFAIPVPQGVTLRDDEEAIVDVTFKSVQ